MINENNPVIREIQEAREAGLLPKKYTIYKSTDGNFAIKDQEGLVYEAFKTCKAATKAKLKLEEN